MPKEPLILRTVNEGRERLRKRKPYTKYKGRLTDPDEIVDKSVEGNIFRVFGGLDDPSACYRTWARGIYPRLQSAVASCLSQNQYDRMIQRFAGQLAIVWKDQLQRKLPYGPATKMINLLVKTMFLNDKLLLPDLPKWYNVPFDSFTLVPLVLIIDDLLPDHPYAVPMNKQMTMNYVIQEGQYRDLQQAIRTLCRGTGRSPLDYELWAWDSRH